MKCSELGPLQWLMIHGENVRDASFPEYVPDGKIREWPGVEHTCTEEDWPPGKAPEGVWRMDENHSEETEAYTVSVEPGDPHNDQMLAQTRDDLRGLLDVTIHPMIDQAEAQNADLASMMAALVNSWVSNNAYMPRERLASLAALLMFMMANGEREIVANGKTRRR